MRFRPLLIAAVLGAACSGDSTGGDVLVVSTVEVTPPGGGLTVGGTLQLSATGKTSGGVTVPDRAARWSSSNATVASVSSSGLVTGNAIGGPVSITATIDRASASVSVTVTPKPVASVTVEPAQAQVVVGAAAQFTAVPRDAQGQPLDGRPVSWDSEQPTIATVTTTGSAIGVAVGVATIRATSEGKVGTATLTVAPRPASRLGFTTQPANGVAGQPLGPVRVAVQDEIGGTVTTATTAITLGLADNPGGATLGGTLTANAVQGVATFSDLVLDKAAAGYILRASGAPLSPALSNPFAIGASAASALSITTQPSSSAPSGVAFAQQPVVQLRDGLGNAVAQAGVTITAALVGATGTLGGTVAVATNASGTAVFTNLAITAPAGNYTLRFTSPGLTEVLSSSIAIAAGTAARLAVTTQPSATAQSGVPLAQPPVVQLQDASGNPVAQAGITITVSVSAGGSLGGSVTAVTNLSGAATFVGLSITGPAGNYTLSFSSPGLTGATSTSVTLGAGGSAGLQIVTQPPAGASSGVPLATQPAVRLVDGAGNPVSQAGVTITASVTGAGATVTAGATATTGANGVATFTGLTITGIAGNYTLTFTAAGLSSVTSTPIALGGGAQAGLAMARQPSSSAQSGVPFPIQPLVQVVDGSGNAVAAAGITVTASLASGPGTLGGTLTAVTNGAGLATFTDLAVTGASGTYTIRFTAPGLTPVVSGIIGVGAGVATQLTITTQPAATAQSGIALTTQPVIQLRDGSNNPVALAGVAVTAAIASGSGTLGGTVTVNTDAAGVATFTDLAISGLVGDRTLEFTSPGLASVTSGTIALSAGAAARLAMAVQPSVTAQNTVAFSQQPAIQVQDGAGNPVAASGVDVTAAIATGGGTLGGTTTATTNASGLATFTNLAITGLIGARTLEFTAPGLTPVTSGTVTLTAGAATQLAITTQPSSTAQSGVAFPQQPVIQLQDVSGNAVAQAGINVTAAIASGGGTLGGTATVATNASGTATFTGLSITGPAGGYTLGFSAPGLSGVTSSTITLGAGAATQLTVTTQPPVSVQSGVTFGTAPVVQLRDGSGNAVAVAGVDVSVALVGAGTLRGTLTVQTGPSGTASFPGLSILSLTGIRSLAFSSPGLTGVGSNNITITAGPAARLGMAVQPPGAAQSGVAFSPQPGVQVQDSAGNSVAANGVAVTASIATGAGGTLGGSLIAATDAGGLATFTNLSLSGTSGNYTLRFANPTLDSVVSTTVVLGAGAPSQLSILTQPSATVQNGVVFPVQPVIQLRDASNNPVALSGVQVTVTIQTGNPLLSGTLQRVTDGSGQAVFTDLEITGVTGPRTLIFAASGYVSVSSNTVTVNAGPAAALAMATQPSASAQSGILIPQQPAVRLVDESGNFVSQSGVSVTATLNGGGSLTPNPATATTDGSGIATFTNLVITGTAGIRTLSFASAGLTGTTSDNINLTAGAASQLTLTTVPSGTAQSGAALAQQPAVQLRDGAGNAVSQAGVTITTVFATTPGGTPSLANPTAITDANGLATFAGLAITGLAGNYTLQFGSGALTPVTSGTIVLSAGAATNLTLTTQPSATASNTIAFTTQPVVQLRDGGGNAVSQSGVTVTAVIATAPPGTSNLTSATATTNGSGVATFVGLAITGPEGAYTLRFESGALGTVTSGTITLSAGPAATLEIDRQPSSPTQSGAAFGTQPRVRVRDVSGNNVGGATVTAAITAGSGQPGATLGGTTGVASAGSGLATFTNLAITGLADTDYTLTFSATGTTPVVSAALTITAGTATRLLITTEPGQTSAVNGAALVQQPVVQVVDQAGNPVNQNGTLVTAEILTGGGTLTPNPATATTNASGTATFAGLTITGLVGPRTLRFTTGGLASDTSATVTLEAGAANTIAANSTLAQTATAGTNVASAPSVLVTDISGNPVEGVNVTFTVASGGGTISPASPAVVATNVSGVAALTSWTLGATVGQNSVTATAAVPNGSPVTFTADGTVGAASQVSVTGVDASSRSGVAFTGPVVATVLDAGNNPVSGAAVTATLTGAGGLLGTTSGNTDASGQVTFTGLGIASTTLGSRTLTFTVGAGPTPSTTANTTLAAGPAKSLAVTSQPTSGTSGVALGALVVQLRDSLGNNVDSTGASISVTRSVGTAALTGTSPVLTAAGGTATFSDLTLTGASGIHRLLFAATGLASAETADINLGAGAATQINVTGVDANSRSGVPFTGPVVATVLDVGNNPVSGAAVTATLTGAGGLLGTTSGNTNASGQVTFTGLGIASTTLGSRTLTFTVGAGPTPNTTANTTLAAGPAKSLAVTSQPTSGTNGVALGAFVVQLRDSLGNNVDSAGASISVTRSAGTATLTGTSPVLTVAGGTATFSDLTFTGTIGVHRLQFAATGLTSAETTDITLGAGAPTTIEIRQPSTTATNGVALAQQPRVRLVDGSGNPVNGIDVTVSLNGGGTLGGTLTVATADSGVAVFTDLSITGTIGTKSLTFTAGALDDTSNDITLEAGVATQLVITTQPGTTAPTSGVALDPQGVVQFLDSGGNVATSATDVVTASLFVVSGAGTLAPDPATKAAVLGVADFTGIGITVTVTTTGTFRIRYTAGSLQVDSDLIAIAAPSP